MMNQGTLMESCDYDHDPTPLCKLIRHRIWATVKYRSENFPSEVRTVIQRRRKIYPTIKDRKIETEEEWHELPMHLVISNDAPYDVFKAILKCYPQATKMKGQKGNLPIHLAVSKDLKPEAINLLLALNPPCIDTTNDDGLTPYQMVLQESRYLSHRDYYLRALQLGPTYSAITATVSDLFCSVPMMMREMVTEFTDPDNPPIYMTPRLRPRIQLKTALYYDSFGTKMSALTTRVEQMFEVMSSVTADAMCKSNDLRMKMNPTTATISPAPLMIDDFYFQSHAPTTTHHQSSKLETE